LYHCTGENALILNIYVENSHYPLDVPEALLGDAEEFYAKMDSDMDQGWQMSREWVEKPNVTQRCQIAADKLMMALKADNPQMVSLIHYGSRGGVSDAPLLMQVVELGGYPDFTSLYQRLGYRVEMVNTGRKAISALKKLKPDVVVAEFNHQFEFRDRTSHLESILAALQSQAGVKVVVFYDKSEQEMFDLVVERFPAFTAMAYPIDEAQLEAVLK
jgi:hypothetical protein